MILGSLGLPDHTPAPGSTPHDGATARRPRGDDAEDPNATTTADSAVLGLGAHAAPSVALVSDAWSDRPDRATGRSEVFKTLKGLWGDLPLHIHTH